MKVGPKMVIIISLFPVPITRHVIWVNTLQGNAPSRDYASPLIIYLDPKPTSYCLFNARRPKCHYPLTLNGLLSTACPPVNACPHAFTHRWAPAYFPLMARSPLLTLLLLVMFKDNGFSDITCSANIFSHITTLQDTRQRNQLLMERRAHICLYFYVHI